MTLFRLSMVILSIVALLQPSIGYCLGSEQDPESDIMKYLPTTRDALVKLSIGELRLAVIQAERDFAKFGIKVNVSTAEINEEEVKKLNKKERAEITTEMEQQKTIGAVAETLRSTVDFGLNVIHRIDDAILQIDLAKALDQKQANSVIADLQSQIAMYSLMESELAKDLRLAFIPRIQQKQLRLADEAADVRAASQQRAAEGNELKYRLLGMKEEMVAKVKHALDQGAKMVMRMDKRGCTWLQRAIMYSNDKLIYDANQLACPPPTTQIEMVGTLSAALSSALAIGNRTGVSALLSMGADIYRPTRPPFHHMSLVAFCDAIGEKSIRPMLIAQGDTIRVPSDPTTDADPTTILRILDHHLARVTSYASTMSQPSEYDKMQLNLIKNNIANLYQNVFAGKTTSVSPE